MGKAPATTKNANIMQRGRWNIKAPVVSTSHQ